MTERLLQVTAPHFCAGSIWKKIDGEWRCVEAAPIIRWMVGKDTRIKWYLIKKKWRWVWLS